MNNSVPVASLAIGLAASLIGSLPTWSAEAPFTEHVISTTADGASHVIATDMDGDGNIDVLSSSYFNHKIVWYESDGGSPPAFIERVVSSNSEFLRSIFAADLDNDGDTDVLSASDDNDRIMWYESDGCSPLTFTEHIISTTADFAVSVFAADVDGDGDTDVLSASVEDDKIAWYENNGSLPPSFIEHVISTTADGAFSVFAKDVDRDGDIDVLSASFWSFEIAWYESDGGSPPTFTERVISTNANRATSVFATDVDGDGDIDVLSTSQFDNKIAWYESDGGSPPTFTERVISNKAILAQSVFAVDVNDDGNIDVVTASGGDDKIVLYESDGSLPPVFTERLISSNADDANSVYVADMDGDGDIDVLSASFNDNKIAWYENRKPCAFDSDCDGDADLYDFASFQIQFTGPK